MKEAHIRSTDGSIDIKIPMGDGPALITGGLGGWQTIDRQDDIAATDWVGQGPLTQDVPLFLDGYPTGDSVEREWNTVKKLGRDATGNEHVPPVFTVDGPVEYPGKAWVLPEGGIDPDPTSFIRRDDGELLRVAFTLHLLEFVKPDEIRLRGKKKPQIGLAQNVAVGGTYTTRDGDTLHIIAARIFNDASQWKVLSQKNGIADPNRKLPAGKVLKV